MAEASTRAGEKAPVHMEVLAAALRLCGPDDWMFRPIQIVRALSHRNESSVRTHVVSRCCVNAPENHDHRLPYFRRVRRGVYEIMPDFRRTPPGETPCSAPGSAAAPLDDYGAAPPSAIHAVITRSEDWYVAECLEAAVVTQGRTFDETLGNLRDALELHLDVEECARIGLPPNPRLVVSYETSVFASQCPA